MAPISVARFNSMSPDTVVLPRLGHSRLENLFRQRLPLVHEAFLITLNDRTGEVRLNPESLSLLLASLALGELLISGYASITGGQLAVATHAQPAQPFLASRLEWMRREQDVVDVPTWLRAFTTDALDDAASELEVHGWLRIQQRRPMVSRKAKNRYRPIRADIAWRPTRLAVLLTGLGDHLRQGYRVPWEEVLLASLLDVVGMLDVVLWDSPRDDCHRALRWCLSRSDTLAPLVSAAANTHAAMIRAHLI